jgi:tetraprenyl-beta-curcumene synthase
MASTATINPLPLSRTQVGALASATMRELAWVLPESTWRAHRWRRRAKRIPDSSIRADAMCTFDSKRGNLAGATLFMTLRERRNADLLQALITQQTLFDFLDDLHERHPTRVNGHSLYTALIDAFIPGGPLPDYYAHHLAADDGGYLKALVEDCRLSCAALPSFGSVQVLLVREARRAQRALTLNHLPNPDDRNRAMRRWAEREFPEREGWHWYELNAAASGQLAIYALMVLASKANLGSDEIEETYAAYWPVVPALTTMLDSFVDQAEDGSNGDHQYVSHYPEQPVDRLVELIEIAADRLSGLPQAKRHMVILGCMVTFYLAKDSARTTEMDAERRRLLETAGSLPQALAPVLRLWRTAYLQRAA